MKRGTLRSPQHEPKYFCVLAMLEYQAHGEKHSKPKLAVVYTNSDKQIFSATLEEHEHLLHLLHHLLLLHLPSLVSI
jgi:hypothetical protein